MLEAMRRSTPTSRRAKSKQSTRVVSLWEQLNDPSSRDEVGPSSRSLRSYEVGPSRKSSRSS